MKAHIKQPYTKQGQKALDREIKSQLAEYDRKNMYEVDAMVLWVLYEKFGFGKKRLKQFFDCFNTEIKALIDRYQLDDKDDACEIKALIDRYQLDDKDDAWICTRKLKDAGIDIEQWEREAEEKENGKNK